MKKTIEKNRVITLVTYLCLSLFVAVYCEMLFEMMRAHREGALYGLITDSFTVGSIARTLALFLVLSLLLYLLDSYVKSLPKLIYKYRFLLAAIIVIIGVLLKLNGSSLGSWGYYLEDSTINTLWGIPRYIRSDEWIVNISIAFSQDHNSYAPFSDIVRGSMTNMSLPMYAPNWSLSALFQPFSWGYLLFDLDHGLAFSWIMPKVALFMASFECAMIYTHKRKPLSLAAAFLLSFSPLIVWWNVNTFLLFGQLLVICLYHYLRSEKLRGKILSSAGIAYFASCYLMLLYPAWQVPFFFVFALLGLWIILEYRKDRRNSITPKTFKSIRDLLILLCWLLVFTAIIVSVFNSATEALQATNATVYPAGRISTGGDLLSNTIVNYPVAPFFTFITSDSTYVLNACEEATMFSLFPLGLLLGCYLIYKRKDSLLTMLVIIQAIFLLYAFIGFPEWLSRITLLSNVPAGRILFAIGFIDILLLLRSATLLLEAPQRSLKRSPLLTVKMTAVFAVVVAIIMSTIALIPHTGYLTLFQKIIMYGVMILLISQVFLLIRTKESIWQKLLAVSVGLIIFVSGVSVNPIQVGSSTLTENKLYKEIEAIADSEETLWISDSIMGRVMANFCVAAGAPTINSLNAYPYLERWEALDPKGEYAAVYNRYAHIDITLQNSHNTSFELLSDDFFSVQLNWHDLEKLGVTHILSANQFLSSPVEGVSLTEISSASGYYIYLVTYSE